MTQMLRQGTAAASVAKMPRAWSNAPGSTEELSNGPQQVLEDVRFALSEDLERQVRRTDERTEDPPHLGSDNSVDHEPESEYGLGPVVFPMSSKRARTVPLRFGLLLITSRAGLRGAGARRRGARRRGAGVRRRGARLRGAGVRRRGARRRGAGVRRRGAFEQVVQDAPQNGEGDDPCDSEHEHVEQLDEGIALRAQDEER